MSSRLVALDKCPGVRPIGIGECLRRILSKCMIEATGSEITEACGQSQLCSGLSSGIEGAIHAMIDVFQRECLASSNWGMLLVDANNAFNAVNRQLALWQARIYSPHCARFLYNTYNGHAELLFHDSDTRLYSREGVTQGDPLAMLLYAVATLPIINKLKPKTQSHNAGTPMTPPRKAPSKAYDTGGTTSTKQAQHTATFHKVIKYFL